MSRSGTLVDEPEGEVSDDGLVMGTHLHGPFDNELVRRALLAWLRARRGPPSPAGPSRNGAAAPAPDPHDRWADALEAALDVALLLERCGIAPPVGGGERGEAWQA